MPLFIRCLLVACLYGIAQPLLAQPTPKTNAQLAQEGFQRCHRYLRGWLTMADPASGLIPRNLTDSRDIWNAYDAAADNYPFMVLTAALLDKPTFDGPLRRMLQQESQLTARIGPLPDTYSFSKRTFEAPLDTSRIFFGSAEYMKDGLLPLTEWLGPSPWSDRMLAILDELDRHVDVVTQLRGKFVGDSPVEEINGDLLQVLTRLYWMTGRERYLDWAVQIGDHYLLGNHHPTGNLPRLRLRDHGGEIVEGLCELYATVHVARPAKKKQYEVPIHQMIDRLLTVGTNADGLFYDEINPVSGQPLKLTLADTWGYLYDGIYTVYLVDSTVAYRDATRRVLANLDKYVRYDWESGKADGYADAIEGAITLYNREPTARLANWIDSQIQVMWQMQQPSGIVEGWHGDGNFARTTLMYCLWKTQGIRPDPWRDDLRLEVVRNGNELQLMLQADKPWLGRLLVDQPRSKNHLRLPFDWPRINQFPEWFTAKATQDYRVEQAGRVTNQKGSELWKGIPVEIRDKAIRLTVEQGR